MCQLPLIIWRLRATAWWWAGINTSIKPQLVIWHLPCMPRTLALLFLLHNILAIICWHQDVWAVSVVGMTANKNITQYPVPANIGQYLIPVSFYPIYVPFTLFGHEIDRVCSTAAMWLGLCKCPSHCFKLHCIKWMTFVAKWILY